MRVQRAPFRRELLEFGLLQSGTRMPGLWTEVVSYSSHGTPYLLPGDVPLSGRIFDVRVDNSGFLCKLAPTDLLALEYPDLVGLPVQI